jgi:hypothetical protein
MKQTFALVHDTARRRAMAAVVEAPAGHVVTVSEPNRNLSQNAAQWPILQSFSEQLLWPVNGRMVQMTPEEWKDVLTAAFRGEQARLAMGLAGGVVMLGQRTREFSKREFSDWLEFLHATAADRGVDVERAAA